MPDKGDRGDVRAPGGRIAAAIAGHLTRANVATRVAMKGHMVDIAMQAQHEFFRLTGGELVRVGGALLRTLATDPDTGDNVRPLLHFVAQGQGQFATLLGQRLLGTAASYGLTTLLGNELQGGTGRIIAQNPNLPISPADAARAAVTGQTFGLDTEYEAAQQGIDARKFNILKALATEQLDPGTIAELYRRGELSLTDAVGRLELIGHTFENAHAILSSSRILLPPAALADMVVRGVMAGDAAQTQATHNGLTGEDFQALVRNAGEPPAIDQLLFANRRGTINDDRLVHGIHQSRVRDEWIDVIKSLSHQPMSTADAVEAHVQGHLSEADSRRIAAENGLMPEHWKPLYDTAGSPPGVQEMVSMWHRGKLTKDELLQGIAESRLKNKYIQKVIDASETLPPERSIVSLVTKGALTQQAGYDLLLKRGYAPDIATALMSEAHVTKNTKTRDLAESQIVALYEDQAIPRDQAAAMLDGLKYTPEESDMILMLADLRRIRRYTDAAVAKVRSAYVGRRTDENGAANTLDALHVPPDQRDALLRLWNLERDVSTKELTLAQAHAALKAGLIDASQFGDRLLAMGYSTDDTAILVALYAPAPAGP